MSSSPAPPQDLLEYFDQNIDWVSLFSAENSSFDANNYNNYYCASSSSSLMAESSNNNSNNIEEKRRGGRLLKNKKKKTTTPKFAFQTRSADDVLDDGYRWRKYGQKAVKNSIYPRSYYKCTQHTCNVKKQVQRETRDRSIVVTTYEGIHNHPCEMLMQTLTPLLNQIHLLTSTTF